MIRCLLANNDSVVDKFLSESVLELEYLEKKVTTNKISTESVNLNVKGAVGDGRQA